VSGGARASPGAARVGRNTVVGLAAVLLAGATAYVLVPAVPRFARRAVSEHPVSAYVVRQYWLSYEHGFARRALPGQVLHWLSGGADPGYRAVRLAGVGLTVAAVLAIGVLGMVLARRAGSRPARIAVLSAVVGTSLTVSLYLKDVGRTDAVGVVVLVVLGCLPWRRLSVPVVLASVAVLTTVAAASEEFLIAVVAPVAALVLYRRLPAHRRRRGVIAAALIPSLLLAGLSAVLPVPERTIDAALAAADAAGAPPRKPLVPDHDSVSRLRHGFLDNLVTYYRLTDPLTDVVVALLWAAVFALTVALVWSLLGGSLERRVFRAAVGGFAVAALALSASGIDYHRWWALATVAALATLALSRTGQAAVAPRWWLPAGAAVLAVLASEMAAWPVFTAHLF
jgi:hypothetical protein